MEILKKFVASALEIMIDKNSTGLVTSPIRKRVSLNWTNTGYPKTESHKEEVKKGHKN